MASSIPGQQEYKIGGISVYFPCKPYPSQFSMMDKVTTTFLELYLIQ